MTDLSRMDGKIAIVTGGTQGLGAEVARLFAERGAKGIVICGRNAEKGEAKAAEIHAATGADVLYVKADFANIDDVHAVTVACDKRFGRVDALVARSLTHRRISLTGCLLSMSVRRSL